MPAKNVSVNLLERDQFAESPIGRVITWVTTYGRYIMITTEIIVILAFISRFSLDRKLTDLNEAIAQKQAIIETNQDFEKEVINIQKKLSDVKVLINNQNKAVNILSSLKTILPPDVYLETLNLTNSQLSTQVVAGTNEGFAVLMNNLTLNKQYTKIEVGDIKKTPMTGVKFQLNISLTEPKRIKSVEEVTELSP
jgi:Tfp pilus assembly protein PilN